MTPPAKWFIEKEDDSVVLCTTSSNTPDSGVEKQGIVRDIKSGLVKGKPVLKVRL